VNVITDREGAAAGFAFVEMEGADAAISALDRTSVARAHGQRGARRDDHGGGGSGGGGRGPTALVRLAVFGRKGPVAGGRPFIFSLRQGQSSMRLDGKTAAVRRRSWVGDAIARCLALEARASRCSISISRPRASACGRSAAERSRSRPARAEEHSIGEAMRRAVASSRPRHHGQQRGAGRGDASPQPRMGRVPSEFQPVPPFTNMDQNGWHATCSTT
jgi:hypothetical protein